MTSLPIKLPKALCSKRGTKCQLRDNATRPAPDAPAPAKPKGPAARRGTTKTPAAPAPANPKGPAARSDTTQLPDTPAPATQPGNTDEPAPRAPRNPHNIVHPRLANPAVSPPSPTTNEGAFDSDFKDIFGVATASATHSIPLPLKRGATTPPAKSKPDKAPRKVHDAANVIVLTESDDSGDDIKFESVEADPETLGRLYSHIETCQPGLSLPPRLARSSRGKRFSSGVHNTHCGRCSREFPCNSFRLCDNLMTQTECAPNRCSSMEFCQNQTIRKKRFPKTTVVEDVLLKHGLRIDVDVRSETKIIEYVGEYMSKMDFLRRKRLKQGTTDWYLARVGSNEDLYIDAGRVGNHSRFINHSCIPNCRFQTWYVDTKPRLMVVANHALERGTILSLDYMDAGWNITCLCGACDGNYSTAIDLSSGSDK
ncbi:hypothetical protein AaE_001257 [Aphanomyces astaci]|uniref:SET domain-containing protein n=1 Tax=Aphanomyces astaci TaxID=112090 RepID=A0A6A5B2C1_APHAT|nr:hypothetical protein AaE_001257 [Aphanomyces astaci]